MIIKQALLGLLSQFWIKNTPKQNSHNGTTFKKEKGLGLDWLKNS